MSAYITLDELKAYCGEKTTANDDLLTSICTVVSRMIDNDCGYDYNIFSLAATATTQTYAPDSPYLLMVPDAIGSTSGLVITTDDNDDGVYENVWASTDYEIVESNAIANSQPIHSFRAVGNNLFPTWTRHRNSVQVTAKWGWPAVPDLVKHAAKVAGKDRYVARNAVNGIAGYDNYGPVRIKQDPAYQDMLRRYSRAPVA